MNDIRHTLTIPGNHWLVGALGGTNQARRALGMIAAELLEGLMPNDPDGSTEHVNGLAKRVEARYVEAFRDMRDELEINDDDPRWVVARRDAMLARALVAALQPSEDPEKAP